MIVQTEQLTYGYAKVTQCIKQPSIKLSFYWLRNLLLKFSLILCCIHFQSSYRRFIHCLAILQLSSNALHWSEGLKRFKYSMNSLVVFPLWTYFLWYSALQEEGVSSAIPVTQTVHWAGEPTVAQIGETETNKTQHHQRKLVWKMQSKIVHTRIRICSFFLANSQQNLPQIYYTFIVLPLEKIISIV